MENDNSHSQKEENPQQINQNLQRILGLANKLNTIQVNKYQKLKINRVISQIIKTKNKIKLTYHLTRCKNISGNIIISPKKISMKFTAK